MSEQYRDRLGQWTFDEATGDNVCPATIRGLDHLRNPCLNKVNSFSMLRYSDSKVEYNTTSGFRGP